jgi:Zn-dependent M28 family amino/carboxypeptidase
LKKKSTASNVVGVIEGTDEVLKEEYVTIGGHLDHIPPAGDAVSNGADDNASGSIGVMEIGEAIAMAPFKRSTLVGLWAAEEVGLYGSNFFVNHSPIPLDKAKVHINLDMIARTDAKNKEDRAIYALGTSRLCPAFKEMVERLKR